MPKLPFCAMLNGWISIKKGPVVIAVVPSSPGSPEPFQTWVIGLAVTRALQTGLFKVTIKIYAYDDDDDDDDDDDADDDDDDGDYYYYDYYYICHINEGNHCFFTFKLRHMIYFLGK